ncbi:MAG TPA: DUF4391 domain-containing protein [Candidatus Cloacimonadota bacterium]|nr:DUF4391 domain-containing protein [Candidatus Cloacimonadota bacterium]
MNDNLKLPKEAFVNKFIPKNKFYEKLNLATKLQKEFIDKIQKITWKYKLAESTIGITKTDKVIEIQIFEIELKEQFIPKNVLKVIDKAIPYQILYRFVYNGRVAYAITLKENVSPEQYYFSDWDEPLIFDFSGIDLEKVYQKLIKAFLRESLQIQGDFHDLISKERQLNTLEKEIKILESKIKKEKQFNKKVDFNKILLAKKKAYDLLTTENCNDHGNTEAHGKEEI